tara:strand:- start:4927 stop:5361 length:435 start_codon:yes stop_codon:yes gene_type:complete
LPTVGRLDLLSVTVEYEFAGTESVLRATLTTANEGVKSGQKFFYMKRLRQIVVSACFQTIDLVLPVASGSEKQNRQPLASFAPSAKNIETIAIRQAYIDDGDFVIFLQAELKRALRGPNLINYEAASHEISAGSSCQHQVIFDQ